MESNLEKKELRDFLKNETRKNYKEALKLVDFYSVLKGMYATVGILTNIVTILFLVFIFFAEEKMLMFGLFLLFLILNCYCAKSYSKNNSKSKFVREFISQVIEEYESKEKDEI